MQVRPAARRGSDPPLQDASADLDTQLGIDPPEPRRFRFPWLATAAVLTVLTVATLLVWPTKVDGSLVTFVEAFYAEFGVGPWSETIQLSRFIANVALFVPLAVIVGIATRQWWLGFVVGVATSAGSEFIQRTLPDRVPSVEDLVANTFGAAIGAVIVLALRKHQRTQKVGVDPIP
jgi:glycopeptide antibiotics resistance protein